MTHKTSRLKTAGDWHHYYVVNDPDFIEEFECALLTPVKSALTWEEVARKWKITDIQAIGSRSRDYARRAQYQIINGEKYIRVSTGATEADVLAEFSKLRKLEAPTRGRAPEDVELIYAIFKAKMNKKTGEDIFKMLISGTLPGYSKRTTKYVTSKQLMSYYYDYKP